MCTDGGARGLPMSTGELALLSLGVASPSTLTLEGGRGDMHERVCTVQSQMSTHPPPMGAQNYQAKDKDEVSTRLCSVCI